MDKFIATLNIEHLRKQAAEEPDPKKRRVMLDLLAQEEAKLALILAKRTDATNTN